MGQELTAGSQGYSTLRQPGVSNTLLPGECRSGRKIETATLQIAARRSTGRNPGATSPGATDAAKVGPLPCCSQRLTWSVRLPPISGTGAPRRRSPRGQTGHSPACAWLRVLVLSTRISDPISLDIVMTKWMMVTKEVGHGHEATEEHDSAQ